MKSIKFLSLGLLQAALCTGAFVLTSATIPNGASGYVRPADDDDQPYTTKTFTLSGAGKLKVETSGGNITVNGGSGNQVKVEMFAKMSGGRNADKADLQEEIAKYDITLAQDGNTITATARRKAEFRNRNSHLSISFKVTAPTNVTSNLQTSGGNISLAGLTGPQNAETSGGNITMSNMKGNLDMRTSGGNITSERVNGDVKVETSGGNIDLNACDGKWDARTSGGNIEVENGKGEYKVVTSGGQIELKGLRGSVDARTSGGGIEADIVELDKYLTLHTSGGSIEATIPGSKGLDLDIEGDHIRTSVKNFSGSQEKDRIVGKMNGGGIPVRISTSGSSVALNFR